MINVKRQLDALLNEITKAEDEEEIGIYLLRLHLKDVADLNFFQKGDRNEAERLLKTLVSDTERHHKLLGRISDELKIVQRRYA